MEFCLCRTIYSYQHTIFLNEVFPQTWYTKIKTDCIKMYKVLPQHRFYNYMFLNYSTFLFFPCIDFVLFNIVEGAEMSKFVE